jgi:hypothetical protein
MQPGIAKADATEGKSTNDDRFSNHVHFSTIRILFRFFREEDWRVPLL